MISIDWLNRIIFIPKSFNTPTSNPNIFELDINAFWLALKEIEASPEGIIFPDTHKREAATVISGVNFAPKILIINSYRIEFENGFYGVSATGANNNILDVRVFNSVSYAPNNSTGLTVPISLEDIDSTIDPDGKLKKRLVLQKGADFDIEVI
jgi:hypothetical protein